MAPEQTTRSIRILIADDHPAIHEAIENALRPKMDLDVCGHAHSANEAFRQVERLKPNVAVVDLSLGDAHGLDLVQNIRTQFPDVQIVVFSMYDEQVYAERAIRAGASAYLMKSESTQSLIDAIRRVSKGEVYLSQRMHARILGKVAMRRTHAPGFAIDELTDREMAVFQMLGEGRSIEDITDRLNLSRKTVETYRRRAKEKLGLDTVGELLQYAVRWVHGNSNSKQSK